MKSLRRRDYNYRGHKRVNIDLDDWDTEFEEIAKEEVIEDELHEEDIRRDDNGELEVLPPKDDAKEIKETLTEEMVEEEVEELEEIIEIEIEEDLSMKKLKKPLKYLRKNSTPKKL